MKLSNGPDMHVFGVLKVNQDFTLLFNSETANKLLEKWDTVFKPGIFEEAMGLTLTRAVRSLISSARKQTITEDNCSKLYFRILLPYYYIRNKVFSIF